MHATPTMHTPCHSCHPHHTHPLPCTPFHACPLPCMPPFHACPPSMHAPCHEPPPPPPPWTDRQLRLRAVKWISRCFIPAFPYPCLDVLVIINSSVLFWFLRRCVVEYTAGTLVIPTERTYFLQSFYEQMTTMLQLIS